MKTLFEYKGVFDIRHEYLKTQVTLEDHYFDMDLLNIEDYVELMGTIHYVIEDTGEDGEARLLIKGRIKERTIVANVLTNETWVRYRLEITESKKEISDILRKTKSYNDLYNTSHNHLILQEPL